MLRLWSSGRDVFCMKLSSFRILALKPLANLIRSVVDEVAIQ
jgi:hypothetical protein